MIIGRSWLDLPTISYRKSQDHLFIYKTEPSNGETVNATTLDLEVDYLHVIEIKDEPIVRSPLVETDFGYVNLCATSHEHAELLDLVNEYHDCFTKSLDELGCTPLMTV